jgi:anaphase-promoting complex subunit 4
VAWSDGVVRLVGAESSKNVHQIAIGPHGATGITCLGWASNFISKRSTGVGHFKDGSSWQNVFEETIDGNGDRDTLDLPRDLALIDIESSLPKLSILPAGSTS